MAFSKHWIVAGVHKGLAHTVVAISQMECGLPGTTDTDVSSRSCT